MKFITAYLQTLNHTTIYDNRSPFTIEDIYELLRIPRNELKTFMAEEGDEYTKIHYDRGSYSSIEILKPVCIKNYMLSDKYTYYQKIVIFTYDTKGFKFPTSVSEIPDELKGFCSYTTIKNINKITRDNNIHLLEKTTDRLNYTISTKVGYDMTIGKFVFYSSDRVRNLRTKINNKDVQYWTKKYALLFNSATKRNVQFDLQIEDLIELYDLQEGKCVYSNLPMLINNIKTELYTNPETLSVDRKDPAKGYTKDNIQMCCNIYNLMKSNLSEQDFLHYHNLMNKTLTGS